MEKRRNSKDCSVGSWALSGGSDGSGDVLLVFDFFLLSFSPICTPVLPSSSLRKVAVLDIFFAFSAELSWLLCACGFWYSRSLKASPYRDAKWACSFASRSGSTADSADGEGEREERGLANKSARRTLST